MSIWGILKPTSVVEPIKDQEEVKKSYKKWRLRTFLGMFLGYAFFYLSRKSFTFVMPVMLIDLGFDKYQLGILGSIMAISYGLSKFLSGMLSDRANARFFMGSGLILTGVFNIFFGASSSILFFAIFWGLNGFFQGWGAPPCARLLTHWYSQSERGTFWSLWNTSVNLGGAMTPLIVSYIAGNYGWRYGMYFPGFLCILMGFFVMYQLRDTPKSLGLPTIEQFKNEYSEKKKRDISIKEALIQYVFKNRYIWILSISYFFVYMVRAALNDWTGLYLIESRGYSLLEAGSTIVWFEAGGAIGGIFAGFISDNVFKGKRGPVNVIFILFTLFVVCIMSQLQVKMLIVDSLLMFATGFFLFGPQMLIGVAAVEIAHKKVAGTVNGFVGTFACLGMASAGGPLGAVIRDFGWGGYFTVIAASAVLAFLCLVPLWNVQPKSKEEAA